jgi:hypothetical protein
MQAERLVEQTSELSEWIAQQADQLANSVPREEHAVDPPIAAAHTCVTAVSKAKELMEEANRISADKWQNQTYGRQLWETVQREVDDIATESVSRLSYLLMSSHPAGSNLMDLSTAQGTLSAVGAFVLPKLSLSSKAADQPVLVSQNNSNTSLSNNNTSSNSNISLVQQGNSTDELDEYSWRCTSDTKQTARFEALSLNCSSMVTFSSRHIEGLQTMACQYEYWAESVQRAATSLMHFRSELSNCTQFMPVPAAVDTAAVAMVAVQSIVSADLAAQADTKVKHAADTLKWLQAEEQSASAAVDAAADAVAVTAETLEDCVVGSWSKFGECSAACGGGAATRTRKILRPSPNGALSCPALEEQQLCNTDACSRSWQCSSNPEYTKAFLWSPEICNSVSPWPSHSLHLCLFQMNVRKSLPLYTGLSLSTYRSR